MSRIKKMLQVAIQKVVVFSGFYNEKAGRMEEHSPFVLDGDVVRLKDGLLNDIRISESIFTREFSNNLEDFKIFKFKGFSSKTPRLEEDVVNMIFNSGIEIDGKTYRPFIQSSSQNRDNELVFTSLDRVPALSKLMKIDLNTHPKFNVDINNGGEVVVNKFMSRAGMTLANGLYTNVKINANNFTAINDLTNKLTVQGDIYDYDLDAKKRFEIAMKDINHPVTDGQNYISMVMAAKISNDIKLISNGQYKYFVRNWKGMKSLESDERLRKIFNKFYKVLQLRAPGIKGLFIAIDFYTLRDKFNLDIMEGHNPMSDDIHFILGDGGLKYIPDETVYLQYMQGNKDKRMRKHLSMQVLNSLDLSIEDASALTDKAIEMFENVLTNVDYALEFLGTYFPTELNSESIDEKVVTKVHKALMANPDALNDRWIQKALAKKILGTKNAAGQIIEEGALQRAKFGELPVNGNFFFVIADPYAHLGLGKQLEVGQVHFNGKSDREAALFRYPNVHESEIVRKDVVCKPVYNYLKNVIITNGLDDTLPRMGGADTDGDMLLIVFDQLVINKIPKTHVVLPYGEGAKSQTSVLTMESYDDTLKASVFDNSKIGQITNNATIFRDFENSLNAKGKKKGLALEYHNRVLDLRFLQGYEIDKAKTGVKVEISEDLEPKFIPTWFFRYLYEYKGQSLEGLKKKYSSSADWDLVIDSNSALGFIYRTMKGYEKDLENRIETMVTGTSLEGFVNHIITHPEFETDKSEAIYDQVEKLEKAYRTGFYELSEYQDSDDYDEETHKWLIENLFNEHQGYIDAIDASGITKLYVAYTVVGNNDKESDSYYRAFCFDALLKVYSEMSDVNSVLVPVNDDVEKVTVRGGKIYFDGVETNKSYEILKGRRSSYKTFQLEKGTYIRAELKGEMVNYIPKEERTVDSSLKFIGLRHNMLKGVKAKDAAHMIKAAKQLTINTYAYDKRELIGLYADGEYVGNVLEHAEPLAAQFIGCELKLKGGKVMPITKGDLKGNANALRINFEFGAKVEERNQSPVKETQSYNTYQGDEGYEYVQQAQQGYQDYNYDIPEEFLNRTQAVEDYDFNPTGTKDEVVEVSEVEVIEG